MENSSSDFDISLILILSNSRFSTADIVCSFFPNTLVEKSDYAEFVNLGPVVQNLRCC